MVCPRIVRVYENRTVGLAIRWWLVAQVRAPILGAHLGHPSLHAGNKSS
jgi:hypothetical protein